MKTKKLTALILTLAMLMSFLQFGTVNVSALEYVSVEDNGIKASGNVTSYTEITSTDSSLELKRTGIGFYAVTGDVTVNGVITVASGEKITLIISDGAVLNAESGIVLGNGSSLTIHSGERGTGRLNAGGSGSEAAIRTTNATLTIDGGEISAVGGNYAAGIGGNRYANGGTVKINGGYIKAQGGLYGAGIGGGDGGVGGSLTVNGGYIKATAGGNASAIGGGNGADGGTVVVNNGMVVAQSDLFNRHIGGGHLALNDGTKTFNGGIVFEGNSGAMYGTEVRINSIAELHEGKSLTIPTGSALNIKSEGFFINCGTIINNGTIINDGGLLNVWKTAVFTNNGTVNCVSSAKAHPVKDGPEVITCKLCGAYDKPLVYEGYYNIWNLSQLLWFGENTDFSNGFKARLMSDIEIFDINNDGFNMNPIECVVNSGHTGEFDGNGHKITMHIVVTDTTYVNYGLFSKCYNVSIKNLRLDGGITVNATGFTGALAGEFINGTAENIISTVRLSSYPKEDLAIAGGLFGTAYGSGGKAVIKNCAVYDAVDAYMICGGIVGYLGLNTNNLEISNCAYYGNPYTDTIGNDYYAVGGIIGAVAKPDHTLKISDTYYYAYYIGTQHPAIDVLSEKSGKLVFDMNDISTNNVEPKTPEHFASGEVTYLLNNGITDGSQVWYQTCGADLPDFEGQTVYKGYTSCSSSQTEPGYSNEYLYPEKPAHSYDNACDASCNVCGEARSVEGHSYKNGMCIRCSEGCFEIYTPDDLMWFASHVNSGNYTAGAKLMSDLDMMGYEWIPIAQTDIGETITSGYNATFDGQGHVISNVSVKIPEASKTLGIFGTVVSGGVVENLGVSGISFNSTANYYSLGGVAGQLMTGATVRGCYVINSVLKSPYSAGGIAGLHQGTIDTCYTYGIDLGGQLNRYGGICGDWPTGKVINSYTDFYQIGSTAAGKEGVSDDLSEREVFPERFESGEVAYMLGSVFGQNLDNGLPRQTLPVISDAKVYFGYGSCSSSSSPGYTNFNYGTEKPSHAELVKKYDDTYHWEECPVCAERFNQTAHALNLKYDETYHWLECGCGYNSAVAYHFGGGGNCLGNAVCTLCGQSYTHLNSAVHALDTFTNGFRDCCGAYQPAYYENGVYLISNAGQLYWFADKVNSGGDEYKSSDAELISNITVNADVAGNLVGGGFRLWIPINGYYGTFNGNSHTISGLYASGSLTSVGLFGENFGTVKNVGIIDSYLHTTAVSANIGGIAAVNNGTVAGCFFSGDLRADSHSIFAGAIAGYNGYTATVENCYNSGTLISYYTGTEGYINAGGIVGQNVAGNVRNCHNVGGVNVMVQGSYARVGGIVGYNYGFDLGGEAAVATVSNCYIKETSTVEPVGTSSASPYTVLTDVNKKNEDAFRSGELTLTLNAQNSDGVWRQNIGKDLYPVLKGMKVTKENEEHQNIFSGFEIIDYTSDMTGAVIIVPRAGEYVVIFADYEDDELVGFDPVELNVGEDEIGELVVARTLSGEVGYKDQIMLWKDTDDAFPLCEELEVR